MGKPRKFINLTVTPEVHERLKREAYESDLTLQDWIRILIEREIRRIDSKQANGKT